MGEDFANALKGKRVLVTRAVEQGQQLVRALQEKGAAPVVLPLVAFAPPEDPSLLDKAIRQLALFDWIFLTSQNALRAIQERCRLLKINLPKAAGDVCIAAVGPATAEAARKASLRVFYVASKHTGISLAEELAEQVRGKHVLLPRSDKANPELVETLNRFGAQVTEVVAYRTIQPKNADLTSIETITGEGTDAVLFFSPSAVHHLQDILGNEKFLELSRRAVFAAIGPVTGNALRAAKVERVALARDTTVAAVLETLAGALSHRAEGVRPG